MTSMSAITLLAVLAVGALLWRLPFRRSIPCPSWLSWLVELDNPLFRNNRAAEIIAHLDLEEGMSVLDAGCGPGRLSIPMAARVGPSGSVMAVDIQPAMLEKAKARAERANLANIRFHQGVLGPKALHLGPFDRAVLVTVLGELENPEAALRDIFEMMKAGGVLAVTEVIADPHFQNQKTVRALAAAAGFREKKVVGGRYSYSMYFEKPPHGGIER